MTLRYGWLALLSFLLLTLGTLGSSEEGSAPLGGVRVGEKWLVYELPVGVYQSKPGLLRYFSKGGSGRNILEVLPLKPDPFLAPREGLQDVEKALLAPEGFQVQNSINSTRGELRRLREQLEVLHHRHATASESLTPELPEKLQEIETELEGIRNEILMQKADSKLFLDELRQLQKRFSELTANQESGESLRLQVLQESALRNKVEILKLRFTKFEFDGQSYPAFISSPNEEPLKVVLVRAENQDLAFLFRKHPKDNFDLDTFAKGVLGSLRSSEQKPKPPLLQHSRKTRSGEEHDMVKFLKDNPKLSSLAILVLVSSFAAFIAAGPAHRSHKGEAFVSAPRALMVLITVSSPTLLPTLLLGGAGIASGSPRVLLMVLPLGFIALGAGIGASLGIKRGLSRSELSCRILAALGVPVGMLLALGILALGGFGTRV